MLYASDLLVTLVNNWNNWALQTMSKSAHPPAWNTAGEKNMRHSLLLS